MAEKLGGSSSWALPVEILEMVLAQLPLPALLTVHSTVCQYWSGVIMNPAVSRHYEVVTSIGLIGRLVHVYIYIMISEHDRKL